MSALAVDSQWTGSTKRAHTPPSLGRLSPSLEPILAPFLSTIDHPSLPSY